MIVEEDGHGRYDDYLYMNGSVIFNFALDAVPALMKQNLDAGKITPGMKIMVTGFGVSLSWGGTILNF